MFYQAPTLQFAYDMISKEGFPLQTAYLPEIKTARWEIKHILHRKGETLRVVDIRTSIFTGMPSTDIKLDHDWIEMRFVESKRGVWMSTVPIETYTQLYPAYNAYGKVLVGGLGLGHILVLMKKFNTKIDSIVCVEKNKTLVKKLSPYFPDVEFVTDDISTYLSRTRSKFDFIYLDTWQGTNEATFYDTVLPLRALAKKRLEEPLKASSNIVCWAEETMRGQIASNISFIRLPGFKEQNIQHMEEDLKATKAYKYKQPFFEFMEKHKDIDVVALPDEEFRNLVINFVSTWRT